MNWFRRTCKERKTTLYYWLYTMIIMQLTGLLSIHFTFLYLLCLSSKSAWFTGHENPPNKCAKITRQKNPPVKSAVKTCQIYVRLRPTEFTRRKNPPLQLAACLPEKPPSPLRIPRQDPARHPPPPPPGSSVNGEGGRGQGAGPAHPRIHRYFYFHSLFMNVYIFLYDTAHTYSAQSGLDMKV